MKGKLMLAGMIILGLAVSTLVVRTGSRAADQELPRAVLQGTWAWQTLLPLAPGEQLPLPALVTFHADRTISVADATMFGGLPAANPYRYTPGLGVWEHTGEQEFSGTALYLRFDPATGNLLGILRSRSHIAFETDFNHIKGTMHLDFLSCSSPLTCPDPVSAPAGAWQAYSSVSDFSFTATRLQLVAMPE
jgi:hypothetical protein